MGSVMRMSLLLMQLCSIAFALAVQGSTGYNITPSPTFSVFPPLQEGRPALSHQRKSLRSNGSSPASLPTGSFLHPPIVLSPLKSASVPQTIERHVPPLSPSTPTVMEPYNSTPPSSTVQGTVPSKQSSAPQRNAPHNKAPISVSVAPVPVASPSRKVPHNSPTAHPIMSGSLSPSTHKQRAPENEAPLSLPFALVPVASLPRKFRQSLPPIRPVTPEVRPPIQPVTPEVRSPIQPVTPEARPPILPVPVASPPRTLPRKSPFIYPILPTEPPSSPPDPSVSPTSTPPRSVNRKRDEMSVAASPNETLNPLSPGNHPPSKGSFPVVAPSRHKAMRHSNDASAPAPSFAHLKAPHKRFASPASSPLTSFYKRHHRKKKVSDLAPASSYLIPPHASSQGPVVSQVPSHPPIFLPNSRRRHRAPPPFNPGSSVSSSHSPIPPSASYVSPQPSPSPEAPSGHTKSLPFISPSESSPVNATTPPPPPILALPPPPPNEDCTSTICVEPFTNTPPGSPCGCVFPMQVGLRLSVALYTFFPLVSELAKEIAAGVFMKQSQVRIIGANSANQQPEKTIVLIDLVPLGTKFDNTTAFLTFQRLWHKQVVIEASFFGDYEVLYVHYSGLPPSPPLAPSSIIIDNGPYSDHGNNARTVHPLGVDVHRRQHKDGLSGGVICIIVLSASVVVVICSASVWIFLFKRKDRVCQPTSTPQALLPSHSKPSGIAGSMLGSGPSSASLSFGSSIATYSGSAKTFSASDIEKATDYFAASRIVGEGGFGRVYSGLLEDGTKVAVKVLKRDDQQGGREFLAEVEMLSRLHHRNLVTLIGICTEERIRCLVYELIPNGSVESHLHGVDKETSPLDWGTRMKIALGAARGLAYLHEDSSPRVIHRDFKASNILLEHDFTPKVSDFGLARTAMDEENRHISTRVMGTFGYVAPEYAMTGHLLVKSDVYSYGVVLLELLSGRKPVDMSQPPGQENLVAWARPLLASKEGLETIIDPCLKPDFPFDSVAKVAAIASMCVQPEVSHRPFMGEVVQALKLVCEETKEVRSRSSSQDDLYIDMGSSLSPQLGDIFQSQYPVPNYDSEDTERGLSESGLFSTSVRLGRQASGSFRRHSSSGPLRTGRGRHFWQRMRRSSGGNASEHGVIFSIWPGSH